jgi:hypothetical protein
MDVVVLVSGCFRRNKKVGRLRLAVLGTTCSIVHSTGGRLRGLDYSIGVRNRVERFFRYLKKERTMVVHHKMSARNHIQGINNLKQFLSIFTIYYQAARAGR